MSAGFLTTRIKRTNEVYLCDKRSVGSSRSSKPLDFREPIDGVDDTQGRSYFPYLPNSKLVKAVNLAIQL